jgi:molybdopterin-guanine dinucleotide biosynthesis protein A
MGKDKAFVLLHGRYLLAHVVRSLQPQVEALLINSNGDPARFADFGLPVVPDCVPDHQGPLAGILTGMTWAQRHVPDATHIFSAPCDIPGLPPDIGARLARALRESGAQIAVAGDDDGLQPTIGLWPVSLADRLAGDMAHGVRGMQAWLQHFTVAELPHPGLHNINTPDELRDAAKRAPTSSPMENTTPCAAP